MGIIRTTYDIVTPESAENGDTAKSGFIDEDGTEYSVSEACALVEGLEPSSSEFHVGIWYCDPNYREDFRTGSVESRAYHLKGFSPADERAIYDAC